ncbi:hypothetical protein J622_02831 [Acinetobacter sp. 1564232]|nr:hypothetical protein J622_02831 [Acinetobacter sp. 1564232]
MIEVIEEDGFLTELKVMSSTSGDVRQQLFWRKLNGLMV